MAQAYPTRPVTIIVPFAAGGGTDTLARIMADRMRASLGKPVIIENVAGAGGTIGVARAVRANPDGYTLSIGSVSVYVLNAAVYPIQYDPVKDLQPIALLTSEPLLIVTRKTMPASDLKEFIAWLKAN